MFASRPITRSIKSSLSLIHNNRLCKAHPSTTITTPYLPGITEQIAKHIQTVNDEIEAKREKISRERALRPRKVKSRPVSSQPVDNIRPAPKPNTDKRDDGEGSDEELKIAAMESTENVAVDDDLSETPPMRHLPPRARQMSIQLPVRLGASSRNTNTSDEGRKSGDMTRLKEDI